MSTDTNHHGGQPAEEPIYRQRNGTRIIEDKSGAVVCLVNENYVDMVLGALNNAESQAATIARLREELAEQHKKQRGIFEQLIAAETKLTAYQQAADAVLKTWDDMQCAVGTSGIFLAVAFSDKMHDLAAAHRTATAHDGEREKA